MFGTQLAVALELLLQLPVRHEDDSLFAAFAAHEDLAAVRRHVADLQVGEFADPQACHDQQLDDQERDGILRGQRSSVRAWR